MTLESHTKKSKKPKRPLPDFLNVPWSLRDVVVFVLAWFGLQALIGVVIGIAAAAKLPAALQLVDLIEHNSVQVSFAFDLVSAALGIGVIWLILRKYHAGWKQLGWRRINPLKAVGYVVGVLVAFVVAADLLIWLVSVLVPGFNPNQAQDNEFIQGSGQHHNLAVIALVLLPPFLEETIFRGFIFPAISKRSGVIWGAIWSSALFGLAHLQANISIYTFVLGLVLCFLYVRLKSIIPGIGLHMLNNYLAFLAITSK